MIKLILFIFIQPTLNLELVEQLTMRRKRLEMIKLQETKGFLVKKYDHEFPKKYFNDFLDYININEGDFLKTIDNFRSPHLWEKNEKDLWQLKKKVY